MTETTSSTTHSPTDPDKTVPAPFVSQVALALERACIEMERDVPMGIRRDLDAALYTQCDFFARRFQKFADEIDSEDYTYIPTTSYEYVCLTSDRFRASYNMLNNMQLERDRLKLCERRLDAQDDGY